MSVKYRLVKIITKFYQSKLALYIASTVALMIFIFFGYQLTKLRFDFDFESFFPKDHPDLAFFDEFKEDFAYDNDFLLIALESESTSVFNIDFLKNADKIAQDLRNLKGTVSLITPTDFALPVRTPVTSSRIKVLHLEDESRLARDSARLIRQGTIETNLFSTDLQSIAFQIQHKHFLTVEASNAYMDSVYQILDVFPQQQYHLAGRIPVQKDFISLIQSDFALFIIVGLAIIIVFLTWQFRTFSGVIIPLLIIVWSTVVTLGFIVWRGDELNILTVLIPTILAFVSLSDVIHFLTKFEALIAKQVAKEQALQETIKEIGLATLLTSLTTAVGFLSLVSIKVLPIQMLGVYTGLGVMLAFLITLIIIPLRIKVSNTPIMAISKKARIWDSITQNVYRFSMRNQKTVITVSVFFIMFSVIGMSQLEINAELLDDLPPDQKVRQDFEFFDEQFAGTKPWQAALFVQDPDRSMYDLEVLQEIEKLDDYLINRYTVQNLASPVQKVKLLNQAYNGGAREYYQLPESEKALRKVLNYQKRISGFEQLKLDASKYSRITGYIKEFGSKKTQEQDEFFLKYVSDEINPQILSVKLTGTTYLIDKSHEFLSINLFKGIAFAFIVVSILAMLLFRSWIIIFVVLIPNVLPIIGTAAVIGFLGIPIKLATSIIFTISFGIAVDDTIHYISKFRMEAGKQRSVLYALKNTYQITGKAMILTTLILGAGFGIFSFSNFGATFYLGLFICVTLILALIIDLTLLPVLLHIFYPKSKKIRTKHV